MNSFPTTMAKITSPVEKSSSPTTINAMSEVLTGAGWETVVDRNQSERRLLHKCTCMYVAYTFTNDGKVFIPCHVWSTPPQPIKSDTILLHSNVCSRTTDSNSTVVYTQCHCTICAAKHCFSSRNIDRTVTFKYEEILKNTNWEERNNDIMCRLLCHSPASLMIDSGGIHVLFSHLLSRNRFPLTRKSTEVLYMAVDPRDTPL